MASSSEKGRKHRGAGSSGEKKESSHNVELSKSLSWLLRHNALKEGLSISSGGWVPLEQVMGHKRFQKFSVEDVKQVVEQNDKQRFSLQENSSGKLEIRANQGHSIQKLIKDEELLKPLIEAYPVVIHGTYHRFWESIRKSGLSRMRRNHIHFAAGELGVEGVVSGMRDSSQIYIYVDVSKAVRDGIKFYRSENNVILSEGNEHGFLDPTYFSKVVDIKSGRDLLIR